MAFRPILGDVSGIFRACCRSSVVEHSLGKGEVDSSILSGSTSAALQSAKTTIPSQSALQPKPLCGSLVPRVFSDKGAEYEENHRHRSCRPRCLHIRCFG